MEKPQRASSGLKLSARGPKSLAQSWTAVLHVGAWALAGVNGDLHWSYGRLDVASDGLVAVDCVVCSCCRQVCVASAAGCDAGGLR